MQITLIAAVDRAGCIGVAGKLPWKLGSDLRGFKQRTLNKTVVMGRKTFDSIGRPLPQRRNIVMSRNVDWSTEGVEVASSVAEVLTLTKDCEELLIIGGEQVYSLFIDSAQRIELSEVDTFISGGDTCFPCISTSDWRIIEQGSSIQAQDDDYSYQVVIRERLHSA